MKGLTKSEVVLSSVTDRHLFLLKSLVELDSFNSIVVIHLNLLLVRVFYSDLKKKKLI